MTGWRRMATGATAWVWGCLMVTFACGAGGEAPAAEEPVQEGDPIAGWNTFLGKVTEESSVRYGVAAQDREALDAYLAWAAMADPAPWEAHRQLAFWIDTYNAVVIHQVLEHYPEVESVLKVEGFFKEVTYPVAGEERTLDAIEVPTRKLDPRSHFAVVCASVGCPDLRSRAYSLEDETGLEKALAQVTESFLEDREKGLRWEAAEGVLHLSSIFDWYRDDFGGDPLPWVLERLPETLAAEIRAAQQSGILEIRFLEYDWALNDRRRGVLRSSSGGATLTFFAVEGG